MGLHVANCARAPAITSLYCCLSLSLWQDLLTTVFKDGVLVKEHTFDQVRERAEIELVKKQKVCIYVCI